MKKMAKKRILKFLKKNFSKVTGFIKVLWRDREYLLLKITFLAFFALSIKMLEVPVEDGPRLANMGMSAVAGLLCLVPSNMLDLTDPHEDWRKKRQERKKTEESDDVLL